MLHQLIGLAVIIPPATTRTDERGDEPRNTSGDGSHKLMKLQLHMWGMKVWCGYDKHASSPEQRWRQGISYDYKVLVGRVLRGV